MDQCGGPSLRTCGEGGLRLTLKPQHSPRGGHGERNSRWPESACKRHQLRPAGPCPWGSRPRALLPRHTRINVGTEGELLPWRTPRPRARTENSHGGKVPLHSGTKEATPNGEPGGAPGDSPAPQALETREEPGGCGLTSTQGLRRAGGVAGGPGLRVDGTRCAHHPPEGSPAEGTGHPSSPAALALRRGRVSAPVHDPPGPWARRPALHTRVPGRQCPASASTSGCNRIPSGPFWGISGCNHSCQSSERPSQLLLQL